MLQNLERIQGFRIPASEMLQKNIMLNIFFQGCTTLQFSIMESVMVRQRVQNMIGMGRPIIAGPVLVDLTAITSTNFLEMFQGEKVSYL